MKKRRIILYLSCFIAFISCKPSEDENRGKAGIILEDGKEWLCGMTFSSGDFCPPGGDTLVWKLSGDTVINGQLWKKAYASDMFQGFFRQDGEKIYEYITSFDFGPLCIFDFDKKEGDEIGLRYQQTAVVSRVFDTLFENTKRRCMELIFQNGKRDFWVEGIGSLTYGCFASSNPSTNEYFLISCKKDGETLYQRGDIISKE